MTREQLTAVLAATADDALHLDDGSYVDWSTVVGHERIFEVADRDGNVVQLDLSDADLRALVHRLAATVLAAG